MILEMGTGEISCHYPLVTGTSKGGRVDRGACLCGVLPLHPAWTKELLPWCGWLSKVVECRQELLQSECQRGVQPSTSFYLSVDVVVQLLSCI